MPFSFEFPDGRAIGVFSTSEEAAHARATDPEFAADTKGAKLVHWSAGTGQVIQDSIPFHWNPAFPTPVTGKGQFKRLQKQFGTSDYEPKPETKERLSHFAKKAVHDAEHRR